MISTDRVDLVRVVNEIGSVMVVVLVVVSDNSVLVGVVVKGVVEETVGRIGDVVLIIDVVIIEEVSSGTVILS